MRSTPSECRCCSAYLEYGGRLCQQCREELSSDLYDVPKLLASHNAVRGIPDPAAAIKAAREAMEADVKWYDGLIAMHRMVGDIAIADACVRTHGQRIDKLRHALSILSPKQAE